MIVRMKLWWGLLVVVMVAMAVWAQQTQATGSLTVMGSQPEPRSLQAPVDTVIAVEFDRALNPSTVLTSTVRVFGRWSGAMPGTFGLADLDKTLLFTPTRSFSAGEQVMVVLSEQVEADNGAALLGGFSFQFWTQTAVNEGVFNTIDLFSTRTVPSQPTQAYGGVATDFNGDGWLDISIVNEITADVRVFLNKGDGSGLYHDFLQPPTAVNDRASPSEPADFNNDGLADLAVVNIDTDTVSILLGHGDGTFAPQQEVGVASAPRGVAVLDADADGDVDIVTTNFGGAGNLALLLNDGQGVFGAPTFFEGGGTAERAVAAADMNEDGILDLVIGTYDGSNPQVLVNIGNGDGTFSFASAQGVSGRIWMVNAGDVNGDGHADVVTVNSSNNTGAVLLGDGQGNLGTPAYVNTGGFPLATDLGDIDGDGDLDWVTSSYSGNWLLFMNDGQGNFGVGESFAPTTAASCALMLDFDNNGTLDLALIDEVADEVHLVQNPPMPLLPQMSVGPTVVSDTVMVNTAVSHTLTITNQGTADLSWQLAETACDDPVDVSWLEITPVTGTLTPLTTMPVDIVLDSTGLLAGDYEANLCLSSNDPLATEQQIPIRLRVVEPPPVEWLYYLPLIRHN